MLSLKRYYLRFFDFAFLATLRFVVRLAGFLLATFFFFAITLTSSHSNVNGRQLFFLYTYIIRRHIFMCQCK